MTIQDQIQLYKPHFGQQEFHNNKARFRILACGRRWGKTIACVNEMMYQAWNKPGSINWWVAPVYDQAEVAWAMIQNHFQEAIEYSNKSKMMIVLKNRDGFTQGAEIRFKSAEKINNLRGWGVDFLVMDEAAFVEEDAWIEALRPTLSDKMGRGVFIGTPQGKNWFYRMYQKGQDPTNENYHSITYSSQTNPHFPEEEWDEVKKEMPEAVFKQEYEAAFIERAGMIYPEWDKAAHVVEPFQIPSNWYVYAGVDFGYTNPFAVIWVAIDPDGNYYIIDEYYEPQRQLNEHIISIKGRQDWVTTMYFADPSGKQYIAELQTRGLYCGPAINDVLTGINRVAELLKSGKMKVFSHCRNTMIEFDHYMWEDARKSRRKDMKEQPKKQDDHAMDALRYVVMMTYHTRGKPEEGKPISKESVKYWMDKHRASQKYKKKFEHKDSLGYL